MEENKLVSVYANDNEINNLLSSGLIEYVEEDETVHASSSRRIVKKNVKNKEWNIRSIKADSYKSNKNDKIKVAVLDSGVDDYNDIHLANAINLIPGEEEVLPLFWDVTGHGTSVAGIIAAEENGRAALMVR